MRRLFHLTGRRTPSLRTTTSATALRSALLQRNGLSAPKPKANPLVGASAVFGWRRMSTHPGMTRADAAGSANHSADGGNSSNATAKVTTGLPATRETPYERLSGTRGASDLGWLKAKYSFSFSPMYREPLHRGFRTLRVLNEDVVMAGGGFDTHPHQNMEIVTYVMSGAIEHADSMGNKTTIQAGEVQRMTAGRGVQHSEYNRSTTTPTHLLQIWLHPHTLSLPPSYQQSCFTDDDKRSGLRLIASADGRDGSIVIHQNADLFAALLGPFGQRTVAHYPAPQRHLYLHVAKGALTCSFHNPKTGQKETRRYSAGDGLGLSPPWNGPITFEHSPDTTAATSAAAAQTEAEFLLFDLA